MCQAIVKPAGILIEKAVLLRAWESNSDGAGFAVRTESGHIDIHKGFFKFKSFWKVYKRFEHLDCLIHFRWATHGANDRENCHPFALGDSAVIHNGILSKFLPHATDKRSDTRLFIEEYLAPAVKEAGVSTGTFLTTPWTKHFLESLIGSNKIAALTPEGFVILNETYGEHFQGVWYSAGYPEERSWRSMIGFSGGQNTRSGSNASYATGYGDDEAWEQAWENWNDDEKTIPGEVSAEDVETDPHCTLCECSGSRLYRIGADTVCDACWLDYTTPMRRGEY